MIKLFSLCLAIVITSISLEAQECCLPANLQEGLVGYWPFCGNANDESGNGNDGVVNGATLTEDRFGNSESAYQFFDFTNIECPLNSTFFANDFTVSMWAKFDGYNSGNAYPTILIGQNYYLVLQFTDTTIPPVLQSFFGSTLPGQYDGLTRAEHAVGSWVHVILKTEGGISTIYFDGIPIASADAPSEYQGGTFGENMLFGGGYQLPAENFNGLLDDIGIWNRALNEEEIQLLFTFNSDGLSGGTIVSEQDSICYGDPLTLSYNAIGATGPGGGVIFYDKGFESDGWRYLECSPEDLPISNWGCTGQLITDAYNITIGRGDINTDAIFSQCLDPSTAANRCQEFFMNGQDDWYLPSLDEFQLINENLILNGLGNFSNISIPTLGVLYWTSSQIDATQAWSYSLENSGTLAALNKTSEIYVRPIRKISESEISYSWSTGQTTPTITIYSPGNYSLATSHAFGESICCRPISQNQGCVATHFQVNFNSGSYLPDSIGNCEHFSLIIDYPTESDTIRNIARIQSINFNIEHSSAVDLVTTIQCPNGQRMTITDNNTNATGLGVANQNDDPSQIGFGFDYYFFDDPSLPSWSNLPLSAVIDNFIVAPGQYDLISSLDSLIGCPINGEWILEICDNLDWDDGFLFDWGISINPPVIACLDSLANNYNPTADINGNCTYDAAVFVFNDLNNNGIHDNGESGISAIQVLAGNAFTSTNSEGYASVNINSNNSAVTLPSLPQNWLISVQSAGAFDIASGVDTIFIGLTLLPGPAEIIALPYGPQDDVLQCIEGYIGGLGIQNTGSQEVSGFMTLTCDSLFTPAVFSDFALPPIELAQGQATWEINNFQPGDFELMSYYIAGPGTDYVGNTYPFQLDLLLYDNDGNTVTNQSWITNVTVSCAYDPNDLTPTPLGYTDNHFIQAGDRVLFRVRFQNLGNAPATNVTVEQYIDSTVWDIDSYTAAYPIAAEVDCLHDPGDIDFTNGLLVYNLQGINLPDSTSDPLGSQRQFHYWLKAREDLPAGTQLFNQASIIFDSNPTIITNQTYHTIFDCNSFTGPVGDDEICLGDTATLQATQPFVDTYTWSFDAFTAANDTLELTNLSEGLHTITLFTTNELCGMSGETHSFVVNVNPIPNNEISNTGGLLTAPDGNQWQWYYQDNAIGGATESSYTVQDTGAYYVFITNEFGCSVESETFVYITGIEDFRSPESPFIIAPNPMHSEAVVLGPSGNHTFELYNQMGACVRRWNSSGTNTSINRETLAAGVYQLKVSQGEVVKSVRLVVE